MDRETLLVGMKVEGEGDGRGQGCEQAVAVATNRQNRRLPYTMRYTNVGLFGWFP